MDEARARELRLEEHFPDGSAGTGFNYMFTTDGMPDNMVMLEVRMPTETMRLFFERSRFADFAREVAVVAHEINDGRTN